MKQLIGHVDPEMPLKIGVTGHRTNRLTADDCVFLKPLLKDVFAGITKLAPQKATLWTGMAEGTDVIAAAARPVAWGLSMVLTDTVSNWARRLEAAHPPCAQVFQTECNKVDAQITQVATYRDVGMEILKNCDLLIAVWDGQPGATGGTGEVVSLAREQATPVLHIPFPLGGPLQVLI